MQIWYNISLECYHRHKHKCTTDIVTASKLKVILRHKLPFCIHCNPDVAIPQFISELVEWSATWIQVGSICEHSMNILLCWLLGNMVKHCTWCVGASRQQFTTRMHFSQLSCIVQERFPLACGVRSCRVKWRSTNTQHKQYLNSLLVLLLLGKIAENIASWFEFVKRNRRSKSLLKKKVREVC